jgi:hypothetical protein
VVESATDRKPLRILYCRCAYAQVVPAEAKDRVLERLCESGAAFDSVADLCEMSARRHPALNQIAATPGVKIAACYDRAVRGLFHAAGAPLGDDARVLNMRAMTGDEVADDLLGGDAEGGTP